MDDMFTENDMDQDNNRRKKYVSLRKKAFRAILAGSLILILVGIVAGLLLHVYSSLRHYKIEAEHLLDSMLALQDSAYLEKIFQETKKIFESLPEEVIDDQMSDEFDNAFRPLVDDDFFAARDILVKYRENTGLRNMFLMFPDSTGTRIVYVVDGDEDEWAYLPGQWTEADIDETEKILDSTWRLAITHNEDYGWIGSDAAPVYAQDGELLGYAVVDMDLNDFLQRMLSILVLLVPIAVALGILHTFLFVGLLKKHIIRHLVSMAAAAREYVQMDKVDLEEETPSVYAPLEIETADEMEDLWKSMTVMEADVKDSIIRQKQITAEKERARTEMELAANIQKDSLPNVFPAFPDRQEFEIYASMNPAKEVGGDFYDFYLIDEDHLCLLIADVSGKGVPAALFMMMAKSLLQSLAAEGNSPQEILQKANTQICANNKEKMFVTVWLGILEISTGILIAVNAGHERPIIKAPGGDFEVLVEKHGFVLGAMARMKYKQYEIRLEPGMKLFVYTDGVPEATNHNEEMFGMERTVQALNAVKDGNPEQILEGTEQAVAEFVGDAEQFDDLTMLCLEYKGTEQDE